MVTCCNSLHFSTERKDFEYFSKKFAKFNSNEGRTETYANFIFLPRTINQIKQFEFTA